MAPIRIAFIGLSASSGWALGAHYPYLSRSRKYHIAGVCGSSQASSEATIRALQLPAPVKAYASPEHVAADADADVYDLVVCSVQVEKRFAALRPVVDKGRDMFVEWPLAMDVQTAEELHRLSTSGGRSPRTVIGLQARCSPLLRTVRRLVTSEQAIGKVLSTTLVCVGQNMGQTDDPTIGNHVNHGGDYKTLLTIHFAHLLEPLLHSLDQSLDTVTATLRTQRRTVQLLHPDGTSMDDTRETPDQIALQGLLSPAGAVFSAHMRGGPAFKGSPGLVWYVYGEKGEVEVTAPSSLVQLGPQPETVKVHDHETDEVRVVEVEREGEEAWIEVLPMNARNVARVYEAFANGEREGYADWGDAVKMHQVLARIKESAGSGRMVNV